MAGKLLTVLVAAVVAATALALGASVASARPKDPRNGGTCFYGPFRYAEGAVLDLGPLGKVYCGADGTWHNVDW